MGSQKNNFEIPQQLNLVSVIQMKEALEEIVSPLIKEVQTLRLAIQGNNQNLSLKEFSAKAGLSIPTVRGMIERKEISYNQAGEGKKITIPVSELLKTKQL